MTITTLDANTALLVIDLQNGITALPGLRGIPDVVTHAGALLAAFRRHGLPVILVNVDATPPGRTEQIRNRDPFPAGWTDFIPETNRQPQDHTLTKRTWGAFTNTGLEAHLKTLDVTQVVIAGVSTSGGVESTARHAHELGFNVTLAIDAMTDLDPEAHRNSTQRIFRKLGETGTAREIIDLLDASRLPHSS